MRFFVGDHVCWVLYVISSGCNQQGQFVGDLQRGGCLEQGPILS